MQPNPTTNLAQRGLEEAYARTLLDAAIPGASVTVDPILAEEMGAFTEDALDLDDAVEGAVDNLNMEDTYV